MTTNQAVCEQATLSLAAAVDILLSHVNPLSTIESIPLYRTGNRVVSQAVTAPIMLPVFTNSAMDGYAFRAADFPDYDAFECVGRVLAGDSLALTYHAGQCIQIMTGAMLPDGFDCVIPQECVVVNGTRIEPEFTPAVGANVRYAGEDVQIGDIVIDAGERMTPAKIALLAALGMTELPVVKLPNVGVLNTGDELVMPGNALQPGQIYNSNQAMLEALLTEAGIPYQIYPVVKDDEAALVTALTKADQECDVLITTGGVSVGVADFVKSALSDLGEIDFWKIKIKPGKPVAFGRLAHSYFLGLPGNPVSAAVCFEQFAMPLLARLQNQVSYQKRRAVAELSESIKRRAGREEFQRGVCSMTAGKLQVKSAGAQGSAMLLALAQANCLIHIPADVESIEAGSLVEIEYGDTLFG